jgi:hypothetical protein
LPDVIFHTKIPKFGGPLNGDVFILDGHLASFVTIWYIFPILVFGMWYQEKSGNPVS